MTPFLQNQQIKKSCDTKNEQLNESLAEYDRQQDTLLKENKRLLTENEDLEKDIDEVKREERARTIIVSNTIIGNFSDSTGHLSQHKNW